MKVILASPRGFCAGVKRAIDTVTSVLDRFGAPVYVYHEVVHNRFVVDELRKKGAIFVESLDDVPEPATLIFSAHGVSAEVMQASLAKDIRLFDATCPLVHKVHHEVVRWHQAGYQIIMIGHRNHAEVIGTMGQVPDRVFLVESVDDINKLELDDRPMGYVTQTTLSVDEVLKIVEALTQRYPAIESPKKEDICYATQNRQSIIRTIAARCDVVLVVGSKNSSNSNRLREVAESQGATAYLIDGADQLETCWFENVNTVGVSAGASAPEVLVEGVLNWLSARFPVEIESSQGAHEHITFTIPKEIYRAD